LLLAHENLGKSDETFSSWLETRDASFKQKHLIPGDSQLYKPDRFLDFIEAREALIATRLKTLFAAGPTSASVSMDDQEIVA